MYKTLVYFPDFLLGSPPSFKRRRFFIILFIFNHP